MEELPAFLLRDVEEARAVQSEHVERDEADRTITAAGGHRAGKFVELSRASGAGDQFAVEHGVDAEGGERPQLGEPFPDRSTSPGAHLVAARC